VTSTVARVAEWIMVGPWFLGDISNLIYNKLSKLKAQSSKLE